MTKKTKLKVWGIAIVLIAAVWTWNAIPVEYVPVRRGNRDEWSLYVRDPSMMTDLHRQNICKVLSYYNKRFWEKDGKVYITRNLHRDIELLYNYTNHAGFDKPCTWVDGIASPPSPYRFDRRAMKPGSPYILDVYTDCASPEESKSKIELRGPKGLITNHLVKTSCLSVGIMQDETGFYFDWESGVRYTGEIFGLVPKKSDDGESVCWEFEDPRGRPRGYTIADEFKKKFIKLDPEDWPDKEFEHYAYIVGSLHLDPQFQDELAVALRELCPQEYEAALESAGRRRNPKVGPLAPYFGKAIEKTPTYAKIVEEVKRRQLDPALLQTGFERLDLRKTDDGRCVFTCIFSVDCKRKIQQPSEPNDTNIER